MQIFMELVKNRRNRRFLDPKTAGLKVANRRSRSCADHFQKPQVLRKIAGPGHPGKQSLPLTVAAVFGCGIERNCVADSNFSRAFHCGTSQEDFYTIDATNPNNTK